MNTKVKTEKMKHVFYPDWLVIIITILGLVGITSMIYYIISSNNIYWRVFTALVVVLLLYFIFKVPLWVRVEEESIQVKQLIGSIKITNIETITKFNKKEFNETIRTFGNGGLGGYVGYFSSPGIGKFYMAAVNKNELAKITTKEGKIYVINYPNHLLNRESE